eukprot:CAMPEP_0179450426 /NCGR_PEP_ID=MMETSP0799-20121207/34381_1 /TAXON_ID=46947 /ORGANISM="Geminigera cryophila, Strain CCMP2564" /LENGTH=73 /DNA_ID=CAMNT_0021244475 /DNA_START=720 /DNA_END=938 /DNA_ORIENTATION=+
MRLYWPNITLNDQGSGDCIATVRHTKTQHVSQIAHVATIEAGERTIVAKLAFSARAWHFTVSCHVQVAQPKAR